MSSELDKIKIRIFNMLKRTTANGCTEAEALAAMNMAGKLMDQYDLSMSDVELKETKCVTRIVLDGDKKSRGPMDSCAVNLAAYCDVKIWKNRGSGYSVFGLPQDTEIFEYLFNVIRGAMERELQYYFAELGMSEKQGYGEKRIIRSSFSRGFANRMSQRLKEMKVARNTDIKQTGSQLVVVKMQVVTQAFAELNFKLKKSYNQVRISNAGANNAGYKAAENVQLNSGIHGSVNQNKRLT